MKISKNVRNPSNNVGKSLVNLRQPSIIFGNLRVIFANLRKSSNDFRKSSVTFENRRVIFGIFGSVRVIFGNLRKSLGDLRHPTIIITIIIIVIIVFHDPLPGIHLTLKRLFSAVASPATEFEVSAWKHSKTSRSYDFCEYCFECARFGQVIDLGPVQTWCPFPGAVTEH